MHTLSNLTVIEFFTWVFLLIGVLTLIGWLMKKNAYLGAVAAAGFVYLILSATGIRISDVLNLYR